MATTLEPHPLVVGLAAKLAGTDVQKAITNAAPAAATAGTPTPLTAEDLGDFGAAAGTADSIASFSGYYGGSVKDPIDDEAKYQWQLLFLDIHLSNWLMVKTSDILYVDRVKDDTAACGWRDYIWVKSDALVGRGDATSSAAAIVRGGDFSRAGDISTSLRGDTNARRGGLLFDGSTSAPCCGGNSRH